MDNINHHPISLSIAFGSNNSSLLARTETSSSLDSRRLVDNPSIPIVIIVFDSSEIERFTSASLDRGS